MDIIQCSCNSNPTHKCLNCEPPEFLCLACIEPHLALHPNDSLISLKPNPPRTSPDTICSHCSSQEPKYLEVLTDSAWPICKTCKKLKSLEDPILISVKWKEIVNGFKDLPEIHHRKQVLQVVSEDIEDLYTSGLSDSSIDLMRESLIEAVTKVSELKKAENKKLREKNSEIIKRLKSEAETETLKIRPDNSTEAGILVNAAMSNSRLPKTDFQANQSLDSSILSVIHNFFDGNSRKSRKPEHFIYLFMPGRPVVVRIDLAMMNKDELVFGRNWTFEPSWCELSTKELFVCGGNGLNSTDVLVVNPESLSISTRKPFLGRNGHGLVEVNKEIYVFGGFHSKIAERYKFDSNLWENLAELPKIIQRASVTMLNSQILIGGNDCESIFSYYPQDNFYSVYANLSSDFSNKNKIMFCHEKCLYCLTGHKLFHINLETEDEWRTAEVVDKDWWSHTKPVVHNNCAYFIKYFVRDLWKLDLSTFELSEIKISDIKIR